MIRRMFFPPRTALARARRVAAALVAAGALTAFAAGCGEDKGRPIPAGIAAALVTELDQLQQRVSAGECTAVKRGNLKRIDKRLKALPDDTDQEVRDQVENAVDNLNDLVETECRQKPEPEPQETTPIPTTPPETTPPETTPPETTPEEPKEENGGGKNGGGGEGGGGKGGGDGTGGLPVDPNRAENGGAKAGGKKGKG
jgi:hypothetical protein